MPDLTPLQIRRLYELGPERAIAYLESLGIAVTWDWQEQLRAVRARAFTIAKVASADIIQTVRDEVVAASKSGVSWRDWQRKTGELLARKGYATRDDGSAWRLDTIFRTNMQSAYQAGRYERMSQSSERFPYFEYRAVGDKRTRPSHQELDGLILPRDDPFWKKVWPPNGYGCRCSITALTARQAASRGYKPPRGSKAITPDGRIVDLKEWAPDAGFVGIPGQPLDPELERFDPTLRRQLQLDLDGG